MWVTFIGTTGAIVGSSHDVQGVVRNGVGDYNITLKQNYPAASSAFTATGRGNVAAVRTYGIEHVSDTVKRIVCLDQTVTAKDTATDVIGVRQP